MWFQLYLHLFEYLIFIWTSIFASEVFTNTVYWMPSLLTVMLSAGASGSVRYLTGIGGCPRHANTPSMLLFSRNATAQLHVTSLCPKHGLVRTWTCYCMITLKAVTMNLILSWKGVKGVHLPFLFPSHVSFAEKRILKSSQQLLSFGYGKLLKPSENAVWCI